MTFKIDEKQTGQNRNPCFPFRVILNRMLKQFDSINTVTPDAIMKYLK